MTRYGIIFLIKVMLLAHPVLLIPTRDTSAMLSVPRIPVETRSKHAAELFGKKKFKIYKTALVENHAELEQFLYEQSRSELPDQFKFHARAISRAIIHESYIRQMDPLFLLSIIRQESKFNVNAVGAVGEVGLMQIRPETAKWISQKFNISWRGNNKLFDPSYNIHIGAAYFSYLRNKYKRSSLYLSAYNMGPAKLNQALRKNLFPNVYYKSVINNYVDYYNRIVLASDKATAKPNTLVSQAD